MYVCMHARTHTHNTHTHTTHIYTQHTQHNTHTQHTHTHTHTGLPFFFTCGKVSLGIPNMVISIYIMQTKSFADYNSA